ncbi:MAG TPA: GNAT family N-acetyltransferase [bacterium]|nr:GNAT family N-acetyltransferase [bacterium]
MASPKPVFRPAAPTEVETLLAVYDRHYRGGYSACFDRYGPPTPQDLWWVQSEKAVTVIEVDRSLAGMLVLGRSGRRLLVEEILLDRLPDDTEGLLRQIHDWLTRRFQEERQETLALRCDETNAPALTLVRTFGFTFADALLVAALGGAAEGGESEMTPPAGYQVRRATPADARQIGALYKEVMGEALGAADLERLWRTPGTRVLLAERERFPVAFLLAQVREGTGRWIVGVREAHRRRGLGRALAHAAWRFFQTKRAHAITTYWGTRVATAAFIHALGCRIERAYLYFERPL